MKNKRKLNKGIFLSLIFILVFGSTSFVSGVNAVFAKKDEGDEASDNSGGFLIETEKVDGAMDLLGALQGKIDISEGEIHGLTITKKLDMGKNQDSLIIKIKSPGPIPIKNLYAETIDQEMPGIGGVCLPKKVGWLCLTNVSMTVSSQAVDKISLPDAEIETCFESECEFPTDHKGSGKGVTDDLLKEIQEQESKAEEMEAGITEDQSLLDKIKEHVEEVAATDKRMQETDALDQLMKDAETLLSDEETNKDNIGDLVNLTKEIEQSYDTAHKQTKIVTKTLDQVFEWIEKLEGNLAEKEKVLQAMEKEDKGQSAEEKEKAEVYEALKEALKEKENKQDTVQIDVKDLKKDMDEMKKVLQSTKEKAEKLRENEEAMIEKLESINDDMKDIKKIMKALEESDKAEDPEDVKDKSDNKTEKEEIDKSKEENDEKGDTGDDKEVKEKDKSKAGNSVDVGDNGKDNDEKSSNEQEKEESKKPDKKTELENDQSKNPGESTLKKIIDRLRHGIPLLGS